MFRISLLICISLIVGITAKPWNKLVDAAFQETLNSMDEKDWAVEVEPPEDMDKTGYSIDPGMKIWSGHKGKPAQKAEEDLDEAHHPSVADLLQAQAQNLNVVPAVEVHEEEEEAQDTFKAQPEEDKDDVYHGGFGEVDPEEPEDHWEEVYQKTREELAVYLAPLSAGHRAAVPAPGPYSVPEEDEDDVYHGDEQLLTVQMELLQREVAGEQKVRVYLQPEEDSDELYHKDPPELVFYQDVVEYDTPVDLPSQRRYSEPEEDMDHLYHY